MGPVEVVVLVFRTKHDNMGPRYSLRNIAHNNTPEEVGVDILELVSRTPARELVEIVVVGVELLVLV
ncbi:unnamed protein product [Withania somnifera]